MRGPRVEIIPLKKRLKGENADPRLSRNDFFSRSNATTTHLEMPTIFLTGKSIALKSQLEKVEKLGNVIAVEADDEARLEAGVAMGFRKLAHKELGDVTPSRVLCIGVGAGTHRVTMGSTSIGNSGGYKSDNFVALANETILKVVGDTPVEEIIGYAGCFHRFPAEDEIKQEHEIPGLKHTKIKPGTLLFDVIDTDKIQGVSPETKAMALRTATLDGKEFYINYAKPLFAEMYPGKPYENVFDVGSKEVGHNGKKVKHNGTVEDIVSAIESF
jgi:hypothetical protein